MATIPRSLLDSLTDEINALSGTGRQMVENALSRIVPMFADADGSVPNERVSDLRAAVCEVMEAVCGEVSDLSAARSAEFYDQVRERSVGSTLGALAESTRKPAATDGAVRALMKSVVDTGSTERLVRELGDRVDYEVKKAAGDCVEFNAKRDPLKPRYARVPSGAETCSFCIMLASRGFTYRSDGVAGAVNHYHPSCDCRIVPGFDTYYAGTSRRLSASTFIEGYDPGEFYDQYLDDLKSGKLNISTVSRNSSHVLRWSSESFTSYSDFIDFVDEAADIDDLQQRCAVAAYEWKKTGLSDKYWSQLRQAVWNKRYAIEHQSDVIEASLHADEIDVAKWLGEGSSGIATFETREVAQHEFNAYRVLMKQGHRFTVKAVDPNARSRGKTSPDVFMGGHRWELKCPDGNNEKRTITRNIKKAITQLLKADPPASSVKIILSGLETNLSKENIEYHVKKKMSEGIIDEMIVIYSESDVRSYKK